MRSDSDSNSDVEFVGVFQLSPPRSNVDTDLSIDSPSKPNNKSTESVVQQSTVENSDCKKTPTKNFKRKVTFQSPDENQNQTAPLKVVQGQRKRRVASQYASERIKKNYEGITGYYENNHDLVVPKKRRKKKIDMPTKYPVLPPMKGRNKNAPKMKRKLWSPNDQCDDMEGSVDDEFESKKHRMKRPTCPETDSTIDNLVDEPVQLQESRIFQNLNMINATAAVAPIKPSDDNSNVSIWCRSLSKKELASPDSKTFQVQPIERQIFFLNLSNNRFLSLSVGNT